MSFLQEKFEDTKGVTRSRKWKKDRQYNSQTVDGELTGAKSRNKSVHVLFLRTKIPHRKAFVVLIV
jgi:hypothetical protein